MDPQQALFKYVVRLGDNALVLAQRLIEIVANGPELEEELANANFSLDYLGQARMFYTLAGELEGKGRTEDDFAFHRAERDFENLLLIEQPNGHFGDVMVRSVLFDTFYLLQLEALSTCSHQRLADIAVKSAKEIRYHLRHGSKWLAREITRYRKRSLKRLDVSSRSLLALIEPGSCFTGTLLELALAADRGYMLEGVFEESTLPAATVRPTAMNFGPLPMGNGLTRLETRLLDDADALAAARGAMGGDLEAEAAEALGFVTFTPDDIDWADGVRIAIEARASFSPDSLTGMEASLRFPGPETMETKIFGRLTAWQNWIFQRPNAVGEEGALKLYGTGKQASFDRERV